MTLHLGGQKIKDVYLGNEWIKAIWGHDDNGGARVYSSGH